MRPSIARALVATLVTFASSIPLLAQNPVTPKNVKLSATIAGRVTIKGKGAPGVLVGLRQSEMPNSFDAMSLPRSITDQDGNYKITNVAPGSYDVTTSLPAYVTADNSALRRNVIVGEGENVESINFALVRGGVITGRITDADGRPVIQQQVRLFRADPPDTRVPQTNRSVFPVSSATTDDRGVYRMFGLSAGRYKLSVGGRGNVTYAGLNSVIRAFYKEVFYPDVMELSKATVIEVAEGSEATNIDIVLGRVIETFTARGKVVDAERGQTVPNVRFGMQRLVGSDERSEFVSSFMNTNMRGEFVIEGLMPGKYGVFLLAEANTELRTDNTTFDIIDSDVTGITIRLVKGAAITGMVVLESDDKQAVKKLGQLQMHAYVQNQSGGVSPSNSSQSSIGGDGSFRIAALSGGLVFLNIGPARGRDEMKGFVVARIERDGVVQRGGIEVKDGDEVGGIRVILNYGTAVLRGLVTLENGPLPQGARIYVRLSKTGEGPSNIRPPNIDERGRFLADGLPAGAYDVSVTLFGGGVKPRRPKTQQVVLQNNVVTDVAITIDVAEDAKP